ncbi:KRR1 small subunit processome component homolog [Eumeta japonica]|uniref:KRR-R motif-containing protein 1 n=1 Tax=Eumeta variegata TaxID=151549 RepID=A0A4C1TP39_EUMVA|nr:KRR1 small subunit processome component homolog [Eumeta japonica]
MSENENKSPRNNTEPIENAWAMKIPSFKPEDNPNGLTEESSFATLFPKYREKYLNEVWPLVQQAVAEHNLKAELDLIRRQYGGKETKKEYTPFPPAQPESKIDKQLASGEYFLNKEQKQQRNNRATTLSNRIAQNNKKGVKRFLYHLQKVSPQRQKTGYFRR